MAELSNCECWDKRGIGSSVFDILGQIFDQHDGLIYQMCNLP